MKQRLKENQTIRYGIWVDGVFNWLDHDFNKDHSLKLMNQNVNMVIEIEKNSKSDGTELHTISLRNMLNKPRNLKIFFSQMFLEEDKEEVTFYAPTVQAIIKSFSNHYLLMNGMLKGRGIVQYCTNFEECSSLSEGLMNIHPFATGKSITVFSLEGIINGEEQVTAHYWQCSGSNESEVINNNAFIQLHVTEPTETNQKCFNK